jgi:TonB-dependent receptor
MRRFFDLRGISLLLLALTLTGTGPLAAQETGRIVGRVIDAGQGGPIAGVVLEVVGTTVRAQSAIDGRFTLAGVPAGSVAVRARYIGFRPKVVEGITVPAGGTATQDITLAAQIVELEEISVSASAEQGTVARALEEQRYATGVVSAITQEQISRSPDSDAGQAVQRVSGVTVQDGKYVFVRGLGERYTTTSLNGARVPSPEPERKVVPLDLFPAGLLEGITTSKTFTPEQSGDFSGASVNLKTREFPARRTFTLSTGTAVNDAATGKTLAKAPNTGREWLGFAGSERALPSGLAAAGNLSGSTQAQVNQYIASLRDVWSARRADGSPNGSFGMGLGGEDPFFGQRVGYLASFSYGYSQEVREGERKALATTGGPINQYSGSTARNGVLWGGLLNLSTRLGATSKLQLNNTYTRSADNEAKTLHGVNEEFSQLGELAITRLSFTERSVRSHQLRGEHLFGERTFLDWSATAARTRRYEPDRSDLIYQASVNPSTGEVTPTQWADIRQSAGRTFSDLTESNYELGTNFQRHLGDSRSPWSVKVGGNVRATDRDADSRAYDLRNFNLSAAELTAPPEELFGAVNATAGRLLLSARTSSGRYTATDRVYAGYVQLEIPVTPAITFVGGGRVERWALDLDAIRANGVQVPVRRRNTDVLPAAALNIRLRENQTLRLSATQTLSRPEYREMADITSFDVLGGLDINGNPDLKRALVQNFDARWEFYPAVGEVISFGVFAKRFTDPIERVTVATTGAPQLSFVNAERANNFGLEVEVRKGLGILSPALSRFTAFANTSLIHSRITPGNSGISALTSAERPMVGQAGYVVNAGLSWSDLGGGWSATALFNVVGRRISDAGQNPLPDTYEAARLVLDASMQAPLFSTLTLKVDAKNLLNEPYRLTQGDVVREEYRSGRILGLGFIWRP